jgi:hypothetical protein
MGTHVPASVNPSNSVYPQANRKDRLNRDYGKICTGNPSFHLPILFSVAPQVGWAELMDCTAAAAHISAGLSYFTLTEQLSAEDQASCNPNPNATAGSAGFKSHLLNHPAQSSAGAGLRGGDWEPWGPEEALDQPLGSASSEAALEGVASEDGLPNGPAPLESVAMAVPTGPADSFQAQTGCPDVMADEPGMCDVQKGTENEPRRSGEKIRWAERASEADPGATPEEDLLGDRGCRVAGGVSLGPPKADTSDTLEAAIAVTDVSWPHITTKNPLWAANSHHHAFGAPKGDPWGGWEAVGGPMGGSSAINLPSLIEGGYPSGPGDRAPFGGGGGEKKVAATGRALGDKGRRVAEAEERRRACTEWVGDYGHLEASRFSARTARAWRAHVQHRDRL